LYLVCAAARAEHAPAPLSAPLPAATAVRQALAHAAQAGAEKEKGDHASIHADRADHELPTAALAAFGQELVLTHEVQFGAARPVPPQP